MRDDLSGLNALLIVAEKKSFTAAAAEMRITPSAVSQTIRALEERVGVRLLQRTTRSVGITEAGARFLSRLKPAMDGVHDAYESLGELRDKPAGTLRLNLPRFGYELVLAPKMVAFLEKYPDIDLDIVVDDAFRNIVTEKFDAGIRIGEMVEREMIGVRVSADLRMAVVGSPAYFAKHPKPKHPRDLQKHQCINYRRRSTGIVYKWEFDIDGKNVQFGVHGRLLVNDGEMLTNGALDGLGLAYALEPAVRSLIAEKRLVRVLDSFCVPFPGFFLYYPSRAQISPKLKALVDFLKIKR